MPFPITKARYKRGLFLWLRCDILPAMFQGFSKKLQNWTEANLITQDQAAQILLHEKTRKGTRLSRDLTNVGLFAIVLGFLAIIGANWQDIPPFGKLGLHLILNLSVIAALLQFNPKDHPYKRDACVSVLFGLFLTFIILIAQIYQLHGDTYRMLLFWTAICTPFVWFFGRTQVAIVPWLVAALTAFWLTLDHFVTITKILDVLIPLTALYLPLLFLALARSDILQRYRPGFLLSFEKIGLVIPGFAASLACSLFYSYSRVTPYQTFLIAGLALGLAIIFVAFLPRLKCNAVKPHAFDLWIYLLISGVFLMLPFAIPDFKNGYLAAVTFILYWIYMAVLGTRIHSTSLTDWAIRLIVIRLLIVYLEVFSDMMTTGLGMILSGVLLILLIKYSSQIMALGRRMVRHEI